jgi:hypothetical protein
MKTCTYELLVQPITNFQSTAYYLTQPSVKLCPIMRPMQKFNKIKHLTVKSSYSYAQQTMCRNTSNQLSPTADSNVITATFHI